MGFGSLSRGAAFGALVTTLEALTDSGESKIFPRGFYQKLRKLIANFAQRAEGLLEVRTADIRATHGDDDERTWWAKSLWMTCAEESGRLDVALALSHEVSSWAERHLGVRHRTTLEAWTYTASLTRAAGDVNAAIQASTSVFDALRAIYRQSTEEATTGESAYEEIESHAAGLVGLLQEDGRHGAAADVLRAIVLDREIQLQQAPEDGPKHVRLKRHARFQLCLDKATWARLLELAERADEAETVYRQLLAEITPRAEEVDGGGLFRPIRLHANCCLNLSILRKRAGAQNAEVAELLRAGLTSCRRATKTDHVSPIEHAAIARDLATVIIASQESATPCGSLAEAEGMLREALPLCDGSADSGGHGDDEEEEEMRMEASIHRQLAQVLRLLGRDDEAEDAEEAMHQLLLDLGVEEEDMSDVEEGDEGDELR